MEDHNDVLMEKAEELLGEEPVGMGMRLRTVQETIAEEDKKLEKLLQKQPLNTPRIIQKIVSLTLQDRPRIWPLNYHLPYESYEQFKFEDLKNPDPLFHYDGCYLIGCFNDICKSYDMEARSVLYAKSGIPKTTNFVRGLLALIHFLRPDEETDLPMVLVRNVRPDKTLDQQTVKKELEKSMKEGSKIPVLVVKADYSSNEREEEMKTKSLDYLKTLMETVDDLLEKFNKLPLKYRANRVENDFIYYIMQILNSLDDPPFEDSDIASRVIQPHVTFTMNPCKTALKDRLKAGDITGEEERLKLVRVEAVTYIDRRKIASNDPTVGFHYVYWVNTTKFHIRCIAPSLLEEIDEENGVLNLNSVCLNDTSPDRFQMLLDSFFLIQTDDFHLNGFDRTIDVCQVTNDLPANEKYTVKTSDGDEIQVPKVLFELFTEFDAARRRHANDSEDSNTFELKDFSSTTLSKFLNCLVDVRMFYKESMESKMEIYNLAHFTLASHLPNELLLIILLTAEEKDYEHLKFLTFERRDEMMSLIAEHRPDIVLFWKNLPVDENPLGFISIIANKSASTRYKKIENEEDDDIQIIQPVVVKEEKICPHYLLQHLCNIKQDQDVMLDCKKTIASWNNETSNPGNRINKDRFVFEPQGNE